MMQYSLQTKHRIFVKGYRFSAFAKNMSKNIGNNITKKIKQRIQSKYVSYVSKSSSSC